MQKGLDVLSLTRKLLSFNTITPPGQEHDCTKYIGKLLEDDGFKTSYYEFAKGRTSLIAQMGGNGDKAPICFTGHIDTVPLGAVDWKKDPFIGEIDGNKIYGRGSTDMKGGVAAMIVAAITLARVSNSKAGITLVITAGEETGCQGARYLAELGNVLGKAGAIVVGEPTSNYPLVGHKGALWLEAHTTGVTAHGSTPEQGVNAIYKAAHAITRLQKYNFNVLPHPILGLPTLNIGTVSGGMNINSVPDRAVIGIDIRTIPGQGNNRVYEELQLYLGEEVELKPIVDVGGISTDPQHNWVQQVFEVMERFLHERPLVRGATYFTDASILASAFDNPPTVILGPGELTMAHRTDEFCYISKIEDAVEAYIEIAKKWCNL
jgi:succinyl-diaminopimelate desuccinylase